MTYPVAVSYRMLLNLCCISALSGIEANPSQDIDALIALAERESALPVDRAVARASALRGLIEGIDPHGQYLTADEVVLDRLSSASSRLGLGLDWRWDDASALVTRVVPGSPAALAGLHPGCRIDAVDNVPASSPRLFAAAFRRGNGSLRLLYRTLDGTPSDGELQPTAMTDSGLTATDRPATGILRLRIGRFLPADGTTAGTTTPTFKAFHRLISEPDTRACIVDLRGCPGGTLQAAIEIAAGWLPIGAAVIEQVGRDPARSRAWRADVPRFPSIPVVVLVDGSTASSGEILAEALRRVRGAPVVGQPTVGKWSIQQLFMLAGGDAVQLTVATVRPPGGAPLNSPLQPDVVVAQDQIVTWTRWRAELTQASILPPDAQLERAVRLAQILATAP